MCEDCSKVSANFRLPGERKTKRWCGGCGKRHGAVVRVRQSKMCEGCGKVWASLGLPGERTKRWCSGCGKGHGAVSIRVEPA